MEAQGNRRAAEPGEPVACLAAPWQRPLTVPNCELPQADVERGAQARNRPLEFSWAELVAAWRKFRNLRRNVRAKSLSPRIRPVWRHENTYL